MDNIIETTGEITEVLPGTMFRVKLTLAGKEHLMLGHISGKMRQNYVRLSKADRVKVQISPYDLTKARIVYRLK